MSENITQEQAGRPFEDRVISLLIDMRDRIIKLEDGLNETRAEIKQLSERVAKLEAKQYDMKPIWERALNEIMELRREMAEVRREMVEVRQEMREQHLRSERGFRNFERKLDVFIQDFVDMRDKLRYMEDRFQEMDKRTV